VLCSAALAFSCFAAQCEKTEPKQKKQKRQSKALPHSKKGRSRI
jgi:hypothetical protein